MIKEAFGTGATVEEAVEEAKKALNAPEDAEVGTEIINLPQKKILGLFGGSPAQARAYYDAPEEKKAEAPKPQKQAKPAAKAEAKQPPKQEKKPAVKEEKKKEEAPAPQEVKTYSGVKSEAGQKAVDYVKGIIDCMGVENVEYNVDEVDDSITIDLDCGSGYGYIIGRRGETLDSIQYLTRLVVNKNKDDYKRVSINAGNYREKREDTLKELAKKQAARVKKYGRSVCLDPMNPYERRIIHTTIQEIEGVSSHSVGSESDRKVVITLAEGYKPTHQSRNHGRNGYRRGNRSGSSAAENQDKPARAPRSDFEGSLYGKIEPKKNTEE
ncbi:MAG: KH domain-containing protein [Clostridia bacterium]|nr:KH domain-containing protein [Clostridia bacterium]